ncbi:MAG: hypothetical protein KF760_15960 [Candidatus Eremiobacteraeota bacterium]|nr:hypothetical protein [Candidatus Eremiobacteraeota bacterium]MCW5867384.1 hypothetical protein [Candidatus Eremiobacteraeota bacterium]
MPTTSALHCPNQLSVTRFESRLPSLDHWGQGSSGTIRFLRHRPRNGWKKRGKKQAAPQRLVASEQPSLLRQSIEIGLFGAYMLIFMASLWMLG